MNDRPPALYLKLYTDMLGNAGQGSTVVPT